MTTEPADTLTPPWSRLTVFVLRALDSGEVLSRRTLRARAAVLADLPEGATDEMLGSGQRRVDHRLNWAITHLTKAGLIESPARAQFCINDKGRAWQVKYPQGMDYSEARVYFTPYWPSRTVLTAPESTTPSEAEAVEDPDESMDAAQSRNRLVVGEQLLGALHASDPAFFEQAVVDLLLAMGYGGAEQRGKALGKSGDGGVDGVIDEDVLGLDRIYIQAKRYAEGNNIPADRIQAFVGALHGRAATKGVFITTSKFTPAAVKYVQGLPTNVRLIDGEQLVQLMIRYQVGVQRKQAYWTVELDQDYFE